MSRPARLDDLAAVIAVERNSEMAAHWKEAAYKAILEGGDPFRALLVAEDGGQIAGFAVFRQIDAECELENLVVAPASQRKGLGSELLQFAIAQARARGARILHVEVRASNTAIEGFYKPLGFRETGGRPRYYDSPVEDAVLLSLSISSV